MTALYREGIQFSACIPKIVKKFLSFGFFLHSIYCFSVIWSENQTLTRSITQSLTHYPSCRPFAHMRTPSPVRTRARTHTHERTHRCKHMHACMRTPTQHTCGDKHAIMHQKISNATEEDANAQTEGQTHEQVSRS